MSRVGKYPVEVPADVNIAINDGVVVTRGKLGEQTVEILDNVDVAFAEQLLTVTPQSTSRQARQAWGTMRALLQNAVKGVSEGFTRQLEINGVGFRAQLQGQTLRLALGYSHDINFPIPSDVKITMNEERRNVITIFGISKQRVGQVASNIRQFRRPEPYKGKGVKYLEEVLVRKEGKKK